MLAIAFVLVAIFTLLSLIIGYLFHNLYKVSKKVESLDKITFSGNVSETSDAIEKISNRIHLLELKKNERQQVVKYLPADPPIPGDPGKQGPPGPRGRTLIQDINDLFDGRDEIEVFTRLQESIPSDINELETISSSFSTDEDKAKAIEDIKKTLEKNAKNLYGISKLRKLKQETNELCQEVILSYKKYVQAFEKLHKVREGPSDDKVQEALACKIELKNFQNKIDRFNTNLATITEKKREFFLGDKTELQPDEEVTRNISEEN